jgi:hypothetical protein
MACCSCGVRLTCGLSLLLSEIAMTGFRGDKGLVPRSPTHRVLFYLTSSLESAVRKTYPHSNQKYCINCFINYRLKEFYQGAGLYCGNIDLIKRAVMAVLKEPPNK